MSGSDYFCIINIAKFRLKLDTQNFANKLELILHSATGYNDNYFSVLPLNTNRIMLCLSVC